MSGRGGSPRRTLAPSLLAGLGGALALLALEGRSAMAAETGPAGLTFAEAVGAAEQAPRVTGSAAAARVKRDADRAVGRLTHNPQLTVQPGYRVLPGNAREPELILEVVLPFSLTGAGGARLRAISAEESVLDAAALAGRLEQRLAAGRAWIDLWAAQRVLEEARREEQIAGELSRLVERAAAVAAATRADVGDARGFHAEAALQVLAAEGEVHDLGLALAREAGLRVAGPLVASGALPTVELPPRSEWAAQVERAVALPGARLAALRLRAQRAREVEEKAARGSVMQLGANVQRDAPGGLVASAVVRLVPSWADRGERERASLAAEAARLEGERRSAEIAAATEILMAQHEYEHTAEMSAALSERLVPAAREAAEARARIFQAGEATLPEVLQARRVELVAVSRQQRALGAHAWAEIKLWLLLAAIEPGDGQGTSSPKTGARP